MQLYSAKTVATGFATWGGVPSAVIILLRPGPPWPQIPRERPRIQPLQTYFSTDRARSWPFYANEPRAKRFPHLFLYDFDNVLEAWAHLSQKKHICIAPRAIINDSVWINTHLIKIEDTDYLISKNFSCSPATYHKRVLWHVFANPV